MSHNFVNNSQTSLLFLSSNQSLNSNTIINLIIGILEKESILIMDMRRQKTDSFNTEQLDLHMISRIVFIQQILESSLLIHQIDLTLIKSLTQMLLQIVYHDHLQLNLLPNQIDNMLKGHTFILPCPESFIPQKVQTHQQYLSPQFHRTLFFSSIFEYMFLKLSINRFIILKMKQSTYLQRKYHITQTLRLSTHTRRSLEIMSETHPHHIAQMLRYILLQTVYLFRT